LLVPRAHINVHDDCTSFLGGHCHTIFSLHDVHDPFSACHTVLLLSPIQPVGHYSIARCLFLVRVSHVLITHHVVQLANWFSTSIPREPLTLYADQKSWKGVLGKTHTPLKKGQEGQLTRFVYARPSPRSRCGTGCIIAPFSAWSGSSPADSVRCCERSGSRFGASGGTARDSTLLAERASGRVVPEPPRRTGSTA
jgi:hypothetical protein